MNERVRASGGSRHECATPLRLGTRRRIAWEDAIVLADVSLGRSGEALWAEPLLDRITHQALTVWRAAATALTPTRLAVWAAGPRAQLWPCEARAGRACKGLRLLDYRASRRPECV